MILEDLEWIHVDSLGFTWIDSVSLGLTWSTWIHLDSFEFIREYRIIYYICDVLGLISYTMI